MALLTTPTSELHLECYPKVDAKIQQPWDAADIYLIESANYGEFPAVVNDQWGALSCFLAQQNSPTYSWTDSFCSQMGINKNNQYPLSSNVSFNLILEQVCPTFLNCTGSFWMQFPKSFDHLHVLLCTAIQQLGPEIKVSVT